MPPLSVMFKTVSNRCNLACSYCYYCDSAGAVASERGTNRQLIETFMPQYMAYVADCRSASLAWQGGEPTLANLAFFEQIVAAEARYAAPGTSLGNAIQTNGTLLDDAWGRFLHDYNFLVGISIDGPEAVHDSERRDRGGHGSFRNVMAGVEVLRRLAVPFNVLCVLGPHNIRSAPDLMRFFRREGIEYLQFIPAMAFQASEPRTPARYLISAGEYGGFLVELFDEWLRDGVPRVSIRIFDNFLQSFLGMPNNLCAHGDTCSAGLVIEQNGDCYPCDFYMDSPWKLGNVLEQPLTEIVRNPAWPAFERQKSPLPASCAACEYHAWCKGGCPRNRMLGDDGTTGPDYFCAAYKQFFAYAETRLRALRDRVRNYMAFSEQLLLPGSLSVGRNDRCPCGSNRKHKVCCGNPQLASSYIFR